MSCCFVVSDHLIGETVPNYLLKKDDPHSNQEYLLFQHFLTKRTDVGASV